MEGIPGRLQMGVSTSLLMLAFFSSIHPPKSRPVGSDPASAPFGRRWLQSPKTPLRETSQTDQLEARRGKGLAIVSPLGGAEGEKVKGVREEIWREKEEEPAGPPIFPLLSFSFPSLPLPPSLICLFLPPPPPSFLEKVAGQS